MVLLCSQYDVRVSAHIRYVALCMYTVDDEIESVALVDQKECHYIPPDFVTCITVGFNTE